MSEFHLLLGYLHLYHTHVSLSKPCPSRHDYIFILTNHWLEFNSFFSIGSAMANNLLELVLGWSLLDPHAFVVKIFYV